MSMTQSSEKVMIVDDDPVVLEIARARLEDLGYIVVTHDSGVGTVQLLLDERPNVLLMDVNLPLLTGKQLLDILKGRLDETVVILHSGNDSASLAETVKQTGAVGAIRKTGDDSEFTTQFKSLVKTGKRKAALRP
jgi:CheY-like chemotaxis protein